MAFEALEGRRLLSAALHSDLRHTEHRHHAPVHHRAAEADAASTEATAGASPDLGGTPVGPVAEMTVTFADGTNITTSAAGTTKWDVLIDPGGPTAANFAIARVKKNGNNTEGAAGWSINPTPPILDAGTTYKTT